MDAKDQEKEIELLINRMSFRTPVLVLGAGFSRGVLNGQGKPLPTGSELAHELVDTIFAKLPKASLAYLEEYKQDRDDLKKTCDNIREEGLVKERDRYITQRMKGCHCDPDDYHMLLKCHPWKHIFSLNVDDLVEYIYQTDEPDSMQKQMNIHIKRKSYLDSQTTLELYKLHGSVSNPLLGYVFDSQEYREYISAASWSLERFGQLFLTNDVIFLGTEFQEEDLWLMIEKFEQMVDVKQSFHYFFITPEIKDRRLGRTIESNPCMHHIQWKTKQFFTCLKSKIADVEDMRRKMRDYGMVFYDEKQQEMAGSPRYGSELYYGMPPRPMDFFKDIDIIRPNLEGEAKSISKRGGNQLIILYGMPYVGKTCAALRLGVDLMKCGYDFSVFNLPVSMDAKNYEDLLIEYLSRMPEGAKVAVLAENMPDFYSRVKKIMKKCPPQIGSFVFICTAFSLDHQSKKYLLDECRTLKEIHITEKTKDNGLADAIYDKLAKTNHLNKLRQHGDNVRDCVQYIKEVNDIIDVLYIAQEGRRFVAHFSEWIDKKTSGAEKEAFLFLNILMQLGILTISKVTFLNLLLQCGIRIEMNTFLKNYGDTVQIVENNLCLRCSRLLWDSVKEQLDNETILRYITDSVNHIACNLREGDETIENAMFQKLVKTSSLHRRLGVANEKIVNMLLELYPNCRHLSYYWVQRGIANRDIEKFEEASNAFSEAADIRNNESFHIKHAQAKNYMQWGLWSLDKQPSMAGMLFDEGKGQLKNLITDAPGQYYAYSVHTYVDMMLRFHQKSKRPIDFDELSILLQRLLTEHNDKLNPQITKRFLDYCNDSSHSSAVIRDLRSLYKEKYGDQNTVSPYVFDSDDLID